MACFGDVLSPVSRPVQVQADIPYRIFGMRWYAKGLFMKEQKLGNQIRAKELYRLEQGDLVYNRLFAWKGSFGLVDQESGGGYVSGEFPCFRMDTDRVVPKYLHLYLSQERVWSQVERLSVGETSISRLRLKVPTFLSIEFSLPSHDEQLRIVERTDKLSTLAQHANHLRLQAAIETKALFGSVLHSMFTRYGSASRPLASLAIIARGRGPIYEAGSGKLAINQKCVRWNGVELRYAKEVSEVWTRNLSKEQFIAEQDVLVNSTGEGTIGRACVATPNAIGYPFDSHILVVRTSREKLLPGFLAYFLQSSIGQAAIEGLKGANTTKQTELGSSKLEKILVPVPEIQTQGRITSYLDDVRRHVIVLREFQNNAMTTLAALQPAILEDTFNRVERPPSPLNINS